MQYSIRLYLLFHTSLTASRVLRRPARPPWEQSLIKRLESTASGFSFTRFLASLQSHVSTLTLKPCRKMLLLFNWLGPLTAIRAQQSVPYSAELTTETSKKTTRPFLHTVLYAPPPVLLEMVNAVADDIATFSKMGLLGKKTGERAGRFSDWCWFLSTLVGLVENGVERQMIGNLQQEGTSHLIRQVCSLSFSQQLNPDCILNP